MSAADASLGDGRSPRPSATVVVLRDGPGGLEVLLLRRAERGDHNSGAWVFPGGLVDAHDHECADCCVGLDDVQASARLGLSSAGLAFYVAAVRECFEEAGLLLAVDEAGRPAPADVRHAQWRPALHRGELALADLCRQAGLRLAIDRLVYLSHWLTPPGRAKRFDTRFFLAHAPQAQDSAHDDAETVDHRWMRPADALAAGDALRLMTPTRTTLELLGRFDDAQSALDWAAAPRDVPLVMPRIGTGAQGQRPVLPDEPAWAEIGRLDPPGHGHVSYDIVPGVPVRLSPRVWRVTAPNPGLMTGPGTNSYLVGQGDAWAVIDPGPVDAAHLDRLLHAAPGPIRWILVTHTHRDHSPGAVALKARTGAELLGMVATHAQGQDESFRPDRLLHHGERLALGDDCALRAWHTPGHASNHLCYLLEQERLLFTGDHVMQRSTVVIDPPDGDMAAYLDSLHALLAEPLDWLAPGHGFLMHEPHAQIHRLIEHRLRREARVLEALRALRPATVEQLVPWVYADAPAALHPLASRSLLAHLRKLAGQARAAEHAGRWCLRD